MYPGRVLSTALLTGQDQNRRLVAALQRATNLFQICRFRHDNFIRNSQRGAH